MYKYVDKKVEVGDVVLWTSDVPLIPHDLTKDEPYLVIHVSSDKVKVIDNLGNETELVDNISRKIIKTKSGEEAKTGDTCISTKKDIFEFGSIIEISDVSESFIYWADNKCSNDKSLCVVLEKEEPKQTLQDYLAINGILDTFIYNAKNDNKKNKEQSLQNSLFWGGTPEGHQFWYKHFKKAPDYDGSMDWITDDSDKSKEEDSFCIMFNSVNEIKEAIGYNVLHKDYGYIKGETNENKFPTIFKKCKSLGLSHQSNSGLRNLWLEPKYKEWVKESVTWNQYKDKLKEDEVNSEKESWIGFVYGDTGKYKHKIKANSEGELNRMFEESPYENNIMKKYKYVSTRKEVRNFTDI